VTISPHDAHRRINEWLRVRRAIAHGHAKFPEFAELEAVRLKEKIPPIGPPLRLKDAERCLTFFRRLAQLTSAALASHLGVAAPNLRTATNCLDAGSPAARRV